MNNRNLEILIQEITLGFLNIINADIKEKENFFLVTFPKNYHHIFGNQTLSLTFNPDFALQSSVELIAPGNKLLNQIINLCKTKGPITAIFDGIKNPDLSKMKNGIRFYFYINYEGMQNFSDLKYVDLDLNSSEVLMLDEHFSNISQIDLEKINFESLSRIFLKATDEIRKLCGNTEKKFVTENMETKNSEIENLTKEYDNLVHEVELYINENEKNMLTERDKQKLFDDSMKKIHNLRQEQTNLVRNISEKYRILLSYDLIASSIILYN